MEVANLYAVKQSRVVDMIWRILNGIPPILPRKKVVEILADRYADFDWLPIDMALLNLIGINFLSSNKQIADELQYRCEQVEAIQYAIGFTAEETGIVVRLAEYGYLCALANHPKVTGSEGGNAKVVTCKKSIESLLGIDPTEPTRVDPNINALLSTIVGKVQQ